jgi:hypothetical protein
MSVMNTVTGLLEHSSGALHLICNARSKRTVTLLHCRAVRNKLVKISRLLAS